ncbi:unnamed protein product [Prorocentrum cordatum]|uniref:Uncharacterized protein n=1 Tax=Prorocentrum cordatum TaxID=2364126 RepID=A0ABN9V5J0_9DINO|nr:unnamed protein product [Polarella glacialis]
MFMCCSSSNRSDLTTPPRHSQHVGPPLSSSEEEKHRHEAKDEDEWELPFRRARPRALPDTGAPVQPVRELRDSTLLHEVLAGGAVSEEPTYVRDLWPSGLLLVATRRPGCWMSREQARAVDEAHAEAVGSAEGRPRLAAVVRTSFFDEDPGERRRLQRGGGVPGVLPGRRLRRRLPQRVQGAGRPSVHGRRLLRGGGRVDAAAHGRLQGPARARFAEGARVPGARRRPLGPRGPRGARPRGRRGRHGRRDVGRASRRGEHPGAGLPGLGRRQPGGQRGPEPAGHLRTRMQAGPRAGRAAAGGATAGGTARALRLLFAAGGVRGLWLPGLTATMWRRARRGAVVWPSDFPLREFGGSICGGADRFGVGKVFAALCSGVVGGVLSNPIDVVRVRLMLDERRYVSTLGALPALVREEGAAGCARGMGPSLARAALVNAG